MSSAARAKTLRYLASGRVQRVGFRWHATRAAERLGVTGWVQNLSDGRVEILAQGHADALTEFELEIRQGPMFSRVEKLEIAEIAPEMATYKSFDIR